MTIFRNPLIRFYLGGVVVVGAAMLVGWMQFQATAEDKARATERDARCAKERVEPPAQFKSSADCIGWHPKSDIPLSPAG